MLFAVTTSIVASVVATLSPVAATPVSVPMTLINNHTYVDVTVDGMGPYHFALDSGSPFNLLDSDVAATLGLDVRPRSAIGGVGSEPANAGAATVDSLRLGELTLQNDAFVVTKLHATFGAAEGRPIDGVLGRDVLRRFVTTFDYERATVTFGSDFAAEARGGAAVLAMRLHEGIPQIPCRLAGIAAACNVDTGSRLPITILTPFARANPGIVPANLSALGMDGFGIGGAAYGRLGRLASLELGTTILRDVVCDFSAQTRGAFAESGTAANIGAATLKRFTLTFDYAHDRIALRPNGAFARAEPFDRSGIFLSARDGTLRVLDVRLQTPAADAGVDANDRILALDGRLVSPSNLERVRADLGAEAGTVVTLRVERDGIERDVALTLRDYV